MAHWRAQRLLSVYLWLYSCLDQILDTSKIELIQFTYFLLLFSIIFFFSFMFFLKCCSPSGSGCTQILIFGFIGISLKHLVGQSYIFCSLPKLNATQLRQKAYADICKNNFIENFACFFFFYWADSAFFLQTYNMCFHCSHTNLWICWCRFSLFLSSHLSSVHHRCLDTQLSIYSGSAWKTMAVVYKRRDSGKMYYK